MNFFKQIHESIVSPSFYHRIVGKVTFRQASWFVIRLIMLTALVEGIVHSRQAVDTRGGIPFHLSRVMRGISLRDGQLVSEKGEQYVPPSSYVRELVAFVGATPTEFVSLGDSTLVVDTRGEAPGALSQKMLVRLGREKMEINNGAAVVPVEYATLFGAKGDVDFTVEAIKTFLDGNFVAVSVSFVFFHMFKSGADILFALFFLSFAAYIFRKGKRDFAYSIKIASFAVSPIAVIHMLVALSMTRMAWTGQAALIISSVVLFRAIKATGPQPDEVSGQNSGE